MSVATFSASTILKQICILQFVFYFAFASVALFVSVLFGIHFQIGNIWDHAKYGFDTDESALVSLIFYFSIVVVSAVLPAVVERTRKCLDFVITLAFIHLVLSSLSHGFPWHLHWWLIVVSGCTACTLIGEYLCMREEQREIPLDSGTTDEKLPAIELGIRRDTSAAE